MPPEPWRSQFPIAWPQDEDVTRRQFIAFLALVSGGLFIGTALLGLREWVRRRWPSSPPIARIAAVDELPVGEARLFSYPTPDDRCLLIRLGPERFVAYDQACTHLACPVIYRKESPTLHCPCHEGYFAIEDGRPLAGPPKRPLRRITLALRAGTVWATDVMTS